MEEIVACKVTDRNKEYYFLTWGRVFDAHDPAPLLDAIAARLSDYGIDRVESIRLCDHVKDAAVHRNFYELYFLMEQMPVPGSSAAYVLWCAEKRQEITSGKEIYFVGARDRDFRPFAGVAP